MFLDSALLNVFILSSLEFLAFDGLISYKVYLFLSIGLEGGWEHDALYRGEQAAHC
jgi:hypothetical protein